LWEIKSTMTAHRNLIVIALMSLAISTSAQYVYVPQTIHTPYGNATIQQPMYMYRPMYFNYGNVATNPKFDFTIVLKSDSVITLRSRMEAQDKKMYVMQKEKKLKRKIFPNETKSISGYSSTWGRIKGIPADSCWLFKITKGPINCYSSLPMMDIVTAIAIQKGEDGEIVSLSKENLEAITGTEDEKIKKWLEKDKLTKVIQYFNEVNKPTSVSPK
jgi:hypothetical protein